MAEVSGPSHSKKSAPSSCSIVPIIPMSRERKQTNGKGSLRSS
uniref:Uncharacterized protein n=1 Tax=Arundo donax TaxID=35708 RepID=A0A0A8ZBC3_ARUDO